MHDDRLILKGSNSGYACIGLVLFTKVSLGPQAIQMRTLVVEIWTKITNDYLKFTNRSWIRTDYLLHICNQFATRIGESAFCESIHLIPAYDAIGDS